METNVETAVRICPTSFPNRDLICVQSDVYNNSIKLGNLQSIPVQHALPFDCTQNALYATIVSPLINYFFEGCDVSVVTFGQSGTGKSYTLLGPTLNCALSESEHGVIPRFLRHMFGNINQDTDKHFVIHIAWTQICGENVYDLLGSGSVECSNVSDAFELLKLGMSNIMSNYAHTLFTVTLEQQYFHEGVIQHKVSTGSFIDLASSDKMLIVGNNGVTQYLPTDIGLLTLQKCIWMLSEMCAYNLIPYNQSALTMLLKDSFGGRAKTLLICCVSPLVNDYMETLSTLQFLQRAQLVRNYVTINSYTTCETYDNDLFGLQFATNQLFKLVSNAENLFKNLLGTNSITKSQMEQISDWLMLKQECQECISESSEPHRSLDIIEEEIEDRCKSEESESESDIQNLLQLMNNFRFRTDNLVSQVNDNVETPKESKNSQFSEYHSKGARGRRPSIRSADDFSPLIYEAKSLEATKLGSELQTNQKEKLVKQANADIEGYEKQIEELLLTMDAKEKLMQQLLKHKQTKVNVRKKLKQKCLKLQNDQSIAQNKLQHAKSVNNHLLESKLDLEISELSKKINETEFIKSIAVDDTKTIAELETNLNSSKRHWEKLKKCVKRKEKYKMELENDLKESKKFVKALPPKKEIALSEDCEDVKHEIKELRRTRDRLLEQRYKLDTKAHNKKLLNDVEEQLLLQYEEAIEVIDLAIEYKNQKICGLSVVPQKDEHIYKLLMQQFDKLTKDEILILLQKYYQKVIELRGSTKKLEQQVVQTESQNESLLRQIQNLSLVLQRVRSEAERRVLSLEQQHDHKLQLIMHHLSQEGVDDKRVMPRVVERSKQTALALQVAQGRNKQMDKGSLIARFTRYARHETVPQQLNTALTPSQAKVTRQKNKLIIQQSNK